MATWNGPDLLVLYFVVDSQVMFWGIFFNVVECTINISPPNKASNVDFFYSDVQYF